MRTFTFLIFSLALPLICAATAIDPIGDTYGTGMQFDIASVSGVTSGGSTTFEIRFANPVPAGLDANLWGAIEIDLDRNVTTGKTSELDYPNSHFQLGVDYVIAFYYDDELGTAVTVAVTNDESYTLPAEYGPDYFRIVVPVTGSNSDKRMHYAVGVGDGLDFDSLYSDIAGNNYELLMTETPEPGTWALCAAAFGLIGFSRLGRRQA